MYKTEVKAGKMKKNSFYAVKLLEFTDFVRTSILLNITTAKRQQ
jgi:hypothetical protein